MYKGNPLLRSAEETVAYSAEIRKELIRCMEDVIYFAEKYCHITTIDEGRKIIKLYEFQKRMLKAFIQPPNGKRHVITLASRQIGKTTLAAIFINHYMIFNRDKEIAILANKESTAIEIMKRVKLCYEQLPKWLQVGIKAGGWNAKTIELGNNSKVIAASTGSSAIRGGTYSLLYLDEFAFVPNNIADEFMRSVYPTITSGKMSKVIILSTPNGMNHYYHIWDNAVKGRNNYAPVKINWWEVPGRDQDFKESVIKDLGVITWNQEYGCIDGNTTLNLRPIFRPNMQFSCTIKDLYYKKYK